MASELRVNTLKDASGNNSVATSTVAQGSAKAWVRFDATNSNSVNDSFNVQTIRDNGTGQHGITLTSAMSDTNWSVQCTGTASGTREVQHS